MKNNGGFSLIEVLVGLGILSVASLAFITQIEQSRKAARTLTSKIEQLDFTRSLKNQLLNSETCRATLAPLQITPAALAAAVGGEPIEFPSNRISFQGHPLSNHEFDSFGGAAVKFNVTAMPTANSATGTITIDMQPKTGLENYTKFKTATLQFGIGVDATGAITSCPGTSAPVGGSITANDCKMYDQQVAERRSGRIACDAGYIFLSVNAWPDGRQDGVDGRFLRIDWSANVMIVNAGRDKWRMIAKCCRAN